MERHQVNREYASLHHLVYSTPEGEVPNALRSQVEEMRRAGRPRDDVYKDLKRLVLDLRQEGRDDLEDAVMDVMDVLVGWSSPSARL